LDHEIKRELYVSLVVFLKRIPSEIHSVKIAKIGDIRHRTEDLGFLLIRVDLERRIIVYTEGLCDRSNLKELVSIFVCRICALTHSPLKRNFFHADEPYIILHVTEECFGFLALLIKIFELYQRYSCIISDDKLVSLDDSEIRDFES
jgi:hypothetical protein